MKKRTPGSGRSTSRARGGRADDQARSDAGRRSGDFSSDPIFDPTELFEVIEREDNVHRVLDAMRQFVSQKDAQLLERGVALFVRSARARGEPVETVLAKLESIADELERGGAPGFRERDTPLRSTVLRGVLLAFYGSDAIRQAADARSRRKPK